MKNYRPLPEFLTIKYSEIEGLGLFSLINLAEDVLLGVSHIQLNTEIVRTPLGGFYNHSNDPNCKKVKIGDNFYLKTIRRIKPNEEITVKYTFYKL